MATGLIGSGWHLTHPLEASSVFSLLGGLSIVALGVFAVAVRPRTPPATWFAVFSLSLGGVYVALATLRLVHAPEGYPRNASAVFSLVTTLAVLPLALHFPRRLTRADLPAVVASVALATALVLVEVARIVLEPPERARLFHDVLNIPFQPALLGFMLLLVLRFESATDRTFRGQLALMAAGLTLYVGYLAGYGEFTRAEGSPLYREGWGLAVAFTRLATLVALALLWLRMTSRGGGRLARDLAWLCLATPLAGLAVAAFWPMNSASIGAMRIVMTVLLAYAVLRFQLLGIDVKLRWTISKSTIAAVFIAVFFVASEAAQQFFGDTLQSTYLGIAAAGALVFAIAPLQRAAERLAEKAVPVTHSPSPAMRPVHEEAYRAAVRLALRGGITRQEEFDLAKIAEAYGIAPVRALEIRDEMERTATP